jgi:hypothetical protein
LYNIITIVTVTPGSFNDKRFKADVKILCSALLLWRYYLLILPSVLLFTLFYLNDTGKHLNSSMVASVERFQWRRETIAKKILHLISGRGGFQARRNAKFRHILYDLIVNLIASNLKRHSLSCLFCVRINTTSRLYSSTIPREIHEV